MSSWCRPVWIEYSNGVPAEFEETIPRSWVKGNYVFWPNHLNFMDSYNNHEEPTEKWRKYELVKYRVEEGNM